MALRGLGQKSITVDEQFSSNGLPFVTSDVSRATSSFRGTSGEATALAPEAQFFSDDCEAFRRDLRQRAIHKSTGVLLHLAPKGKSLEQEAETSCTRMKKLRKVGTVGAMGAFCNTITSKLQADICVITSPFTVIMLAS